jgi:hypothetical protein
MDPNKKNQNPNMPPQAPANPVSAGLNPERHGLKVCLRLQWERYHLRSQFCKDKLWTFSQ